MKKSLKLTVIIVLFIVATVLSIKPTLGIRGYDILSENMHPTLQSGDKVIVDKRAYDDASILRGDVVVYEFHKKVYIGRVIGLKGETISYQNGISYINGEPLVEPYVNFDNGGVINERLNMNAIALSDNEVLIMGDNRNRSLDGRSRGPTKIESIVGKVDLEGKWDNFKPISIF